MNKGTVREFIKSATTHRVPKLVTLAVTSCVLVGMITIDASASIFGQGSGGSTVTALGVDSTASVNTEGLSHAGHHGPNPPTTTTTTLPSPTTTTTVPSPTTTTTLPPPPPTTTTTTPPPTLAYPIGTPDGTEPSGYAPPGGNALSGYSLSYVNDFNGSSVPSGWGIYSGQPGGDPGGQFGGSSHITVSNGILSLNTFQDPNYNNEWVTGGLCQCGLAQTYGAYFVRSRLTGPGPTGVELLWPTYGWPPEVDFNETFGGTSSTSATLHYGSNNSQTRSRLTIDMTQWHTWGVIWTPTSVTYTVDGVV